MSIPKRCCRPLNLCRSTFFILLLSLAACKKDAGNEEEEDEFPVLGTCRPVSPVKGLTYESAAGNLTYKTSGGGIIEISQGQTITIMHDDYEGFNIQLWGDLEWNGETVTSGNHENLNGKHIKDRQGSRRTIIFPDGAKFTLVADGEYGRMLEFSIYDGDAVHHINFRCKTLELSSVNLAYAEHFDKLQADGEASAIEFTDNGLIWVNVYKEDTVGNKVENRELLGELDRDNPNMVNDYFDDPRLGHT